ncbi:MAG: hypothetical protein ACLUNO_01115, partial [Oscillospiraceae bacterium]
MAASSQAVRFGAPPASVSLKASQGSPPGGERKFDHFLRRHVRRRKYFSGCKCGICAPLAHKLCAQQTADLLSENHLGFSTGNRRCASAHRLFTFSRLCGKLI